MSTSCAHPLVKVALCAAVKVFHFNFWGSLFRWFCFFVVCLFWGASRNSSFSHFISAFLFREFKLFFQHFSADVGRPSFRVALNRKVLFESLRLSSPTLPFLFPLFM